MSSGYGGHAETAVTGPAPTWYLAEGATHSGFELYYLVANPNPEMASTIRVTYLRRAPAAPVVKDYVVGALSRLTIWVNGEDPALAATDVSGIVSVTNGRLVVVERAMYRDAQGLCYGAGHAAAGMTSPGTRWILPEGATGGVLRLLPAARQPERVAGVRDGRLPAAGRAGHLEVARTARLRAGRRSSWRRRTRRWRPRRCRWR